jgi:hypothetical protein
MIERGHKIMGVRSYMWIPLSFALVQWALANDYTANRLVTINGLGHGVVIAEAAKDGEIEKERGDLPDMVSLSSNGVRYEAIHWGKARGLEQNGGYIAALDEKTGKQEWLVRVYVVRYEHGKEDDKQDVFIRKIALINDKRSLLIENDRGENYILDLKDLFVKGPVYLK